LSLLLSIDGKEFVRSVKAGCIKLEHNRDAVDMLNVFPVPDGDTGTNMYLTLLAAVKEGEKHYDKGLGKAAKAVSMGSLMGARGNSGVILSQVFRGVSRVLDGKTKADALDLALALKSGADTAYEAVMKPVEGTILTVVREIALACEMEAQKDEDIVATLMKGMQAGQECLKKTPSMLPILKEAGVVDAGGQGFLYFLEGFLEGLARDNEIKLESYREKMLPEKTDVSREMIDLEFQYCTELLLKGENLDVGEIREHLAPLGDSMIVVGSEELVKVHIHVNHPGKVLESCLQWGSLSDIKINNMLEEVHEHLNDWESEEEMLPAVPGIGLVAVGSGDGVTEILKSLGVNVVVQGGQTMNPSTEDLLNACNEINAESLIILPNNSNIIMAARQVGHLSERRIEVVATRSVMQAVTALIAFDPEGDIEEVCQAMNDEMQEVKYAEVTYAVRDTSMNGFQIREGDIIGLIGDQIAVKANDSSEAVEKLLEKMVDEDSELLTFFYGEDVSEEQAQDLREKIVGIYPDYEIEVHYGGQPHYSYLLSVE